VRNLPGAGESLSEEAGSKAADPAWVHGAAFRRLCRNHPAPGIEPVSPDIHDQRVPLTHDLYFVRKLQHIHADLAYTGDELAFVGWNMKSPFSQKVLE